MKTMIKKIVIPGHTGEWHAVVMPRCGGMFKAQFADVEEQIATLADRSGGVAVMRRYFLSDAANQEPLLATVIPGAWSVVEQPPLAGCKVAAWVWIVEGAELRQYGFEHGGREHHVDVAMVRVGESSHEASRGMLMDLDCALAGASGSLLGNCVRTWFFVYDVDINYAGVVSGRNEAFGLCGLTADTRFIASTGIGGRRAGADVAVSLDAYSVVPLAPGQMRQISAPEYLNATAEYGVAFERATSIDYGDRRHLFISGTASIDSKGEIVHPGDIVGQTHRMWTNVEALLREGGCSWQDVAHILVYLRDPADFGVVDGMMAKRFPGVPRVVLLAPVCRPGWLIEMECMAVKAVDSGYENF